MTTNHDLIRLLNKPGVPESLPCLISIEVLNIRKYLFEDAVLKSKPCEACFQKGAEGRGLFSRLKKNKLFHNVIRLRSPL